MAWWLFQCFANFKHKTNDMWPSIEKDLEYLMLFALYNLYTLDTPRTFHYCKAFDA